MALLATVAPAGAQEKGQLGINVLVDPSLSRSELGLSWHFSDRVAVRPTFAYSWYAETERTVSPGFSYSPEGWEVSYLRSVADSTEKSWAVGLAAAYYFARSEQLSLYASAAYLRRKTSFERQDSWSSEDNSETQRLNYADEWSTNLWRGLFGAQHSFSHHFSLYGEIGVEYGSASEVDSLVDPGSPDIQDSVDRDLRSFSTLSVGVGVIFYFN